MSNITIPNSFNSYKEDFKKDVGIDAKDNLQLYALYVNARLADKNSAFLIAIVNEVINLPKEIKGELTGLLSKR